MNKNKGFMVPLVLGIVSFLIIVGILYIYEIKKGSAPGLRYKPQLTNEVLPQTDNQVSVKISNSKDTNISTPVSLDMTSDYAKKYKTIFTTAFKEKADFDTHFKLVSIGCGTSCGNLFALDKDNGKVYFVASTNGEYEIVNNNQIRVILNNQNVIYMFNPLQGEFQADYQ
jgi:hypothetical protein